MKGSVTLNDIYDIGVYQPDLCLTWILLYKRIFLPTLEFFQFQQ